MLRIRLDANLPISAGTEMLDKLVGALAANVEARKLFFEAHELTPAVLKQISLERMFGDVSPCPPTGDLEAGNVVPISAAG